MPTTSSSFSPTTGIRENPLRSAKDSTWRTFLSRSANTMSVRGTMTSRTIVSPSSNTELIIARSPGPLPLILTAQGDRPGPGHQVQHGGQAGQRDEVGVPAGAEPLHQSGRRQHYGGRLGAHPDRQEHAQVPARLGQDRLQLG